MIRHLKKFKRSITGNANITTIENALFICVLAFAALGSAQLLFGGV